jgi:hypothetical protein
VAVPILFHKRSPKPFNFELYAPDFQNEKEKFKQNKRVKSGFPTSLSDSISLHTPTRVLHRKRDIQLLSLSLLLCFSLMANICIAHPPMEQLQDLEYCIDSNPPWSKLSLPPFPPLICSSSCILGEPYSYGFFLLSFT